MSFRHFIEEMSPQRICNKYTQSRELKVSDSLTPLKKAEKLWEMGKKIGLEGRENDDIMINNLAPLLAKKEFKVKERRSGEDSFL